MGLLRVVSCHFRYNFLYGCFSDVFIGMTAENCRPNSRSRVRLTEGRQCTTVRGAIRERTLDEVHGIVETRLHVCFSYGGEAAKAFCYCSGKLILLPDKVECLGVIKEGQDGRPWLSGLIFVTN